MFLENKLNCDEKSKEIIEYFSSEKFPLYHEVTYYTDETPSQFSHTMMRRHEDFIRKPGTINSNLFESVMYIFNQFCEQNKIDYDVIYRSAVNCTVQHVNKKVPIHTDHEFPHKIFLLYLNDFTKGETLVYDKTRTIVEHTITPEKYKGVVFSGEPHTHLSCGEDERRMVLVVTFS